MIYATCWLSEDRRKGRIGACRGLVHNGLAARKHLALELINRVLQILHHLAVIEHPVQPFQVGFETSLRIVAPESGKGSQRGPHIPSRSISEMAVILPQQVPERQRNVFHNKSILGQDRFALHRVQCDGPSADDFFCRRATKQLAEDRADSLLLAPIVDSAGEGLPENRVEQNPVEGLDVVRHSGLDGCLASVKMPYEAT